MTHESLMGLAKAWAEGLAEGLYRKNDELIRKQDVIDAFYTQSDDDGWWYGTAQDAEELLKGLPSAEPEQKTGKWIPLKEREPDADGKYLFCTETGFVETIWYSDGDFLTRGITPHKIVAWMPLPEPYQEEK